MAAGCRPSLKGALHFLQEGTGLRPDEAKKTDLPQIDDSVVPIVEAKMCDAVTSDHSLNDLITLILTPGHTIDHYAVTLLAVRGRRMLLNGDLIHTPLQALYPELTMRVDYDPAQGAASRKRFLETYCDTNTLCCYIVAVVKGYVCRWGNVCTVTTLADGWCRGGSTAWPRRSTTGGIDFSGSDDDGAMMYRRRVCRRSCRPSDSPPDRVQMPRL